MYDGPVRGGERKGVHDVDSSGSRGGQGDFRFVWRRVYATNRRWEDVKNSKHRGEVEMVVNLTEQKTISVLPSTRPSVGGRTIATFIGIHETWIRIQRLRPNGAEKRSGNSRSKRKRPCLLPWVLLQPSLLERDQAQTAFRLAVTTRRGGDRRKCKCQPC